MEEFFLPKILFSVFMFTKQMRKNFSQIIDLYRYFHVFKKKLEKLMYKRVLTFLNKQKILTDSQYGFRKTRSTNFAILELVSKISKAVDN